MSKVERDESTSWLLLIHQIPPKPDYLRVKIGRRLQRVGAVAVKNSVYALPDRAESLEDFQWVRSEIVDGGGDASICRAEFVDGLTNEQVESLFRSARDADYAEIAQAAREMWGSVRGRDRDATNRRTERVEDELARLRKKLAAVQAIDFCDAPGRAMAEVALRTLGAEVEPIEANAREGDTERADRVEYRGRVWVTRTGIFVDRIASAWLIRRFIDRDARFKFVDAKRRPARGEVRFDMFEGDFSHVGDRCTFEVLLDRFALTDAALHAIAEVVHDIDLKDEKFGRDDAAGIERVLTAIAAANADDEARLARGSQLFDDLYALFSSRTPDAATAAE
jgi:hypothetical protein